MSQMATRVTTYLVMESILAIAPVVLLDTVERGLEVVAHKLLHWETPLFQLQPQLQPQFQFQL